MFVDGVREFTGLSATLDKIIINPGGGINTFNIGSLTGISSVTINGTNNIDVYDIVSLGLNAPLSIVLAGGNDAVTLGSSPFAGQLIQSPVTVFGDAGNDTLTLGSNNADSIDANVTFSGGASLGGLGDRIVFNDFAPTYNVSYDVASTVVTRDGINVPRTVGYSSVEGIVVNAGSGADTVTVRSAVTPLVTANGNNGNDTFIIGGGNMNGYVPQLFNGGQGIDQITFDDSLNPAGKLWDINQDFHPNEIIYSGLITLPTTGFESVGILAGMGVDNITFYNDILQNYYVDGGAVSANTFRWEAANNYFRNPNGPDASYVVDLVLGPALADNLLLFEDFSRLETDYYVTDSLVSGFDTFTSLDGFDVAYHNAGFVTINGSNERNTFQLVSADPAATYSFFARGGNDRFDLTLDPASGGQSIRTDGNDGSDSLFITDAAFSAASSYAINSSAVTRTSSGGSRFFSLNTMESITVGGTAGDDVFGVSSFTSGAGLTVRGADGNDTLNFGNGNLSASITNIASFTFDGQADFDTFNLRNAASTTGFTYRRNIGTMSASSGAYVLNLSESNVESVFLDAGSGADVFRITAVAAGTELNLSAGAGIDALLLGDLSFSVSEIAGRINFDTGADFGRVNMTDVNSTVGKVAHLDLTSLGAYAGDTLFGPGGSLRFTTLVNQVAGLTFDAMSLLLGSGADTIYAQPFATGTVGIEGRNPTAAPGDTLSLALATAENYVVNGTPANGNVTSSNLMRLSYFGFETGPIVDDVAPFIVAQSYDDSIVPTIFVEFSEDVSGALSVNFLELVNTTTSEQIAFGLMTLSYDAGTNVASYTFPGYVDGVLPAGDYTATIDGTLVDAFGNALGVETPFNFSVVVPASGDFDSDGDADGADFLAWQRGLGIAAPDATRPDGDADGDRDVDGDDLAVWVQQFPAAEVVVSSGNGYSAAAGGAAERMFALGGALSAERVDDAVAGAAAEYANYDLAYRDGFVFNARTVFDPLSTVAGLSLNGGSREERGGEKLSTRGFADDRLDAAVVDLLFARLL